MCARCGRPVESSDLRVQRTDAQEEAVWTDRNISRDRFVLLKGKPRLRLRLEVVCVMTLLEIGGETKQQTSWKKVPVRPPANHYVVTALLVVSTCTERWGPRKQISITEVEGDIGQSQARIAS